MLPARSRTNISRRASSAMPGNTPSQVLLLAPTALAAPSLPPPARTLARLVTGALIPIPVRPRVRSAHPASTMTKPARTSAPTVEVAPSPTPVTQLVTRVSLVSTPPAALLSAPTAGRDHPRMHTRMTALTALPASSRPEAQTHVLCARREPFRPSPERSHAALATPARLPMPTRISAVNAPPAKSPAEAMLLATNVRLASSPRMAKQNVRPVPPVRTLHLAASHLASNAARVAFPTIRRRLVSHVVSER